MIPVPVSLFGSPLNGTFGTSPGTPPAPVRGEFPGIPAAGASLESAGSPPVGATGHAPFADLLTEAVGQVQQLESQAKTAIEGLISGKGVEVHEAMIAAQKAGMGFELMLSVRNKALAAYQQVMGMQF